MVSACPRCRVLCVLEFSRTGRLFQHAQSLREQVAALRQLAVGRELVNQSGQDVGQIAGGFLAADAQLFCQPADEIIAQYRGELFAGNRQVFACRDPGIDDLAQAALLECLDQTGDAARVLVQQRQHQCDDAAFVSFATQCAGGQIAHYLVE